MLDKPPREQEWLSWLLALGWAALILMTVPLAPYVADLVADSFGPATFVLLTAAVILVALVTSILVLRRRKLPVNAYISLFGFGGTLMWLTWTLRDIPVEAFHVLQYGVLSLLVYRALLHRWRNQGVFVLSVLVASIVGILDEWLQWLAPNRFWSLRDVALNVLAALLAQAALAAGLRPRIISGWPSGPDIRRICFVLAAFLMMISISYANTPDRVAWYATRFPSLDFLLDSQSMMVEYGYRHEHAEIGVFRSRFDIEELRRLDLERGREAARIMDRYLEEDDWRKFRDVYTVPRDAYIHEIGTHLFRRNRHLSLARDPQRLEWQRRDSYHIAMKENLILENYFPSAIRASLHYWEGPVRREVASGADVPWDYESAVSRTLITRVTPDEVITGMTVLIGSVLIVGMVAGRSKSS